MQSKFSKLTRCGLVLCALAFLTACSQAAQEASNSSPDTPPVNTPKAETRWDTMTWDQGKWE